MLQNQVFDFVVTDWNMPGMQGIDLLRAIRADEKLKHIPVLMVTAEAKKRTNNSCSASWREWLYC